MGLKYKDPVTGQYIRYNFPLIKGEKGDTPTGVITPDPNSIPQRDDSGNLHTNTKLRFDEGDLYCEGGQLFTGVPQGNSHQVWDANSFPISSGEWTPYWVNLSANMVRQYGSYVRVGNLVYLYLELESNRWLNQGQAVIIGGLPFNSVYETPVNIDMVKGVVEATATNNHHIFGLISGNQLKLLKRGINGTWWTDVKSTSEAHDHFIVRISTVYRIG